MHLNTVGEVVEATATVSTLHHHHQGGGEGGDLGWIVDLAGISRGEDNVQALAWGPMHCKKGGRPGFALARPQALTGPPAALLGYTVPKVIDFPRYYRK